MIKQTVLVLTLTLPLAATAQHRSGHRKETQHTVGIQVNELFRQIFNFNDNANFSQPFPNQNPYLFTYNVNSVRTGWGVRAGIGYFYEQNPTSTIQTTSLDKTTQVRARLGMEKAFRIGGRWSCGLGADAVWNYDRFSREYTSIGGVNPPTTPDTFSFSTSSRSIAIGGGPTTWLRFHLTPRVTLGTEANFYYSAGEVETSQTEKSVRVTNPAASFERSSYSSEPQREARLILPVAIFMAVRF